MKMFFKQIFFYFHKQVRKIFYLLKHFLILFTKTFFKYRVSTTDFFEIYLNYCKTNVSNGHFLSIKKHLTNFWETIGHRHSLLEVSTIDIENFKSIFLKTTTPKTVNKVLKYIKAMFNRALDWNYLTINPAQRVKLIKVPKSNLPHCLTIKEIKELLEKCPPWFYPIIYTFLSTGMRRNELIHLRWCDIDLRNHLIHINNQDTFHTKSFLPRTIGLKQKLYEIFQNILSNNNEKFKRENENSEDQLVFISSEEGLAYTSSVLQKTWMKVRKELGVNYRLHDFRHTFCSYLILRGVDIKTVQMLMGHSDVRTTMQIYSHVQTVHLQKAVEKLPY